VCYYCTTVQGELSDIPARSAGPYIHVGQAWCDYVLPETYNIMHICLIWMLLICSILGRFPLPYWDVSFVCLNTPPCLAYGVTHCIGKSRQTWIYGLLFLLKVYSESSLHNLWGCSGMSHPFHYYGCVIHVFLHWRRECLLEPLMDWWTRSTSSNLNPCLSSSWVFPGTNELREVQARWRDL